MDVFPRDLLHETYFNESYREAPVHTGYSGKAGIFVAGNLAQMKSFLNPMFYSTDSHAHGI